MPLLQVLGLAMPGGVETTSADAASAAVAKGNGGGGGGGKDKPIKPQLYDYRVEVKKQHPKAVTLVRVSAELHKGRRQSSQCAAASTQQPEPSGQRAIPFTCLVHNTRSQHSFRCRCVPPPCMQVGEFYEAVGIDAVLLVQHAGLNPMGDGVPPRAGCPRQNLRRTVDDLVGAGLSVCVCEEVSTEGRGSRASHLACSACHVARVPVLCRLLGSVTAPGPVPACQP